MQTEEIFENFGANAGYVEDLYQLYLSNPKLVGSFWEDYFNSHQNINKAAGSSNGNNISFQENDRRAAIQTISSQTSTNLGLQVSAYAMIQSYRQWGHLNADINPITTLKNNYKVTLNNSALNYDSTESIPSFGFGNKESYSFGELQSLLEETYCSSIGFEYMHIESLEERQWLQERIENRKLNRFSVSELKDLLKILCEAEVFENQLHKTFVGQKRFSLEGGETLIPMIKTLLEHGAELELAEVCIGMAHRGRLTVLNKICGKPTSKFFVEFEDRSEFSLYGSGDVKYHLGHQTNFPTRNGHSLTVGMAVNPSHLEFVNPVVEGIIRAKQDREYRQNPSQALALLIHGDAAFIGQGVVTETMNMSQVEAYYTAGTVHIITNNQVGFTTGPQDARSSRYSSDFAKAINIPVMHINSEDVEAACWASELAIAYRQKFKKDIVLDLYCYRKHGHNEADEPSFTQPTLYAEIKNKPLLSEIFVSKLESRGITNNDLAGFRENAIVEFNQHKSETPSVHDKILASPVHGKLIEPSPTTSTSTDKLLKVARCLMNLPDNYKLHPKLEQLIEKRITAVEAAEKIEWGLAEALAFGSLVIDGCSVRLSGQDCGRGTFNHRHLIYHDYNNDALFLPLKNLADSEDTTLEIYNSTLSEAAVVGFEYGYALTATNALTLWEAQFGDFGNGAQVIIDQYISSSEQKWGVRSGVVLLLPHGYEGQGPEHSSARLERFLQLCADGNMSVCYPTNTAQYFHLLRQQGLREIQRPVIVMTPKSLLRAPDAMSDLSDFTAGEFKTILINSNSPKNKIKNIVFTTGKIAYELLNKLAAEKIDSVQVIRIEQLYPFADKEILAALKDIKKAKILWLQEEPKNMGAWNFVEPRLRELLQAEIRYCGRAESASPSTGSHHHHGIEQANCIQQVIEALS